MLVAQEITELRRTRFRSCCGAVGAPRGAQAEAAIDLPYLRENLPQAFDRCREGLERVATIVSSIREFAHPGQPEMAPVDLNRAIANTLTIARNEYMLAAELETDFESRRSDQPGRAQHRRRTLHTQ